MTRNPRLSIVIPVYNRTMLLENVLEGLMQQTLPRTEYEIIVVDDGSDEPLGDLKNRYPFTFLRLENNCGPAYARNRGIERARGERVLFLDGDGIPAPRLLEEHLQVSAQNPSNTVVIGYRYDLVHNDSNCARVSQDMKPDFREVLYLAETCNLTRWPAPWQACFTNNLSVPRSLLEQIDGFDEHFHAWGVEDVELGYRLYKQHGVEFKLARNAIVFHQLHERDETMQGSSHYNNFKYFLDKHRTFDVEMFFAGFSFIPSKKCIEYDQIQQSIREVIEVCQNNEVTWHSAPDLHRVAQPGAVFCGGGRNQSHDEWSIFHPSLEARSDPISLLGIELPYPSQTFSSVLLTNMILQFPKFLPALLQEAFRLAPRVWLELPGSENVDLTALSQLDTYTVHLPAAGGRLCLLEQTKVIS